MQSSTPTGGRSPAISPPPEPPSAGFENGNANNPTVRRTSLGFLRRAKSTEPLGDRKASGGRISKKMLKEQAKEEELRRQREAAAISKHAPRLPDLPSPPQLKTFGGEGARPDSVAIVSNRFNQHHQHSANKQPNIAQSLPSSTPGFKPGEYMDPYERTESMTHRGRYSYASSAVSTINSPRRVRRRKDPTPYNILVIGTKNSGKTSFLNFLRTSLALPPNKRPTRQPDEIENPPQVTANNGFVSHYLETEIDNERVGLTLWDSRGLEKNIVDLQLREITSFLESKFEDTFAEEMKVIRAPGVRDTHIHCAFLILDPARLDANIAAAEKQANGRATLSANQLIGGLDEALDIQVLRTIQGKTTVVPIISKADSITTAHMAFLKRTVWESLQKAKIDPLEVLSLDDPDDTSSADSVDKFDEQEEDDMRREEEYKSDDINADADQARRTPDSDTMPINTADGPRKEKEPINSNTKLNRVSSSSTYSNIEPFFPLSILSPDPHTLNNSDVQIGRHFPWGFADPFNADHCDFVKLKDSVFGEWRGELREASREVWYERWRTSRLHRHVNLKGSVSLNNGVGGRATR